LSKENIQAKSKSEPVECESKYFINEKLVEKAIGGSRSALCELCEKIEPKVLSRIFNMIGNETATEDVAQNVLLRVATSISSLREPKAFCAWMHTIIVNEVKRHVKRQEKHGKDENIDDYANSLKLADRGMSPLVFTEYLEQREVLLDAIKNLPDRQREALILRYFNGFNNIEVSKKMRISYACARNYLVFAKRKLRDMLY